MALRMKAEGDGRAADLSEVRRALSILADPQYGIQLQYAPFHQENWATFKGGDLDGMVDWVRENAGRIGTYYCHNPVSPDLDCQVTSAKVLKRRWLLIDCDRCKAIEPDNPATDAEHERAREFMFRVRNHLGDVHGWPNALEVDSGNGFQLLYRVALPNSPTAKSLVATLLGLLAEKFDGPDGDIDKKCHDARRVAKLPGTWARRGTESSERPYRMAKIVYAPPFAGTDDEIVSEELIRETIATLTPESGKDTVADPPKPTKLPAAGQAQSGKPNLTMQADDAERNRLHVYGRTAIEAELQALASASTGERNDQLNRSAFALGQLIEADWSDVGRAEVEHELEQIALQIGLTAAETKGTIRSGIEAGRKQPREYPKDREDFRPASGTPKAGEKNGTHGQPPVQPTTPVIYRLPTILSMDIPPARWAVPGMMSEGLTLLSGKPKLGKSWMALNLAITIAAGGKALGSTHVLPGDVLYLALEDRLRRIQSRARKVLTGLDVGASDRLHVAVEWPKQNQGGMDHIAKWMESVSKPTLVIIDVWAKFRAQMKAQGNQYQYDYDTAAEMKAIGDKHGCSVLPIHHCKKAAAEDVVDEISGTLGIAGAADGLLILTRSRGENEGNLFMTGRDIDEKELALEFNPETCCWANLGDAAERADGILRRNLTALFKANPGVIFGVGELSESLKIGEDKKHYLRSTLSKMKDDGLIDRTGQGRYRWPVASAETADW